MTSPSKKRPFLLLGSTFGTTLVSILAAWVVSSTAFAPMVATPHMPNSAYEKSHASSSGPRFRISPIPPGADWTS